MRKYLLSTAFLLPLVIVIVLAMGGVTMDPWIYVALSAVCPAATGILWYTNKNMTRRGNLYLSKSKEQATYKSMSYR
jgi:hypothetical protein